MGGAHRDVCAVLGRPEHECDHVVGRHESEQVWQRGEQVGGCGEGSSGVFMVFTCLSKVMGAPVGVLGGRTGGVAGQPL